MTIRRARAKANSFFSLWLRLLYELSADVEICNRGFGDVLEAAEQLAEE